MATITTKFGVGDVVYFANTTTEAKAHPCPDCLGSRTWEARSPAGGVFKVACPRCDANYQSNRALNLKYSVWTGTARRLTIGLVRANAGGDRGHEYMCHETGIGSGSLYYEDRLFATEEEALRHANGLAEAGNMDAKGWVAQHYSETVKFCDYQLKDAEMEAARSTGRRMADEARYLVEDVEGAVDIEDVKSAVKRWRERGEEAA